MKFKEKYECANKLYTTLTKSQYDIFFFSLMVVDERPLEM